MWKGLGWDGKIGQEAGHGSCGCTEGRLMYSPGCGITGLNLIGGDLIWVCRALNRVEFARFLQRLGVLLHLEAGSLAEQLLVIAERGEDLPSLNDSATAFSMDTRDAVAQVCRHIHDPN